MIWQFLLGLHYVSRARGKDETFTQHRCQQEAQLVCHDQQLQEGFQLLLGTDLRIPSLLFSADSLDLPSPRGTAGSQPCKSCPRKTPPATDGGEGAETGRPKRMSRMKNKDVSLDITFQIRFSQHWIHSPKPIKGTTGGDRSPQHRQLYISSAFPRPQTLSGQFSYLERPLGSRSIHNHLPNIANSGRARGS